MKKNISYSKIDKKKLKRKKYFSVPFLGTQATLIFSWLEPSLTQRTRGTRNWNGRESQECCRTCGCGRSDKLILCNETGLLFYLWIFFTVSRIYQWTDNISKPAAGGDAAGSYWFFHDFRQMGVLPSFRLFQSFLFIFSPIKRELLCYFINRSSLYAISRPCMTVYVWESVRIMGELTSKTKGVGPPNGCLPK